MTYPECERCGRLSPLWSFYGNTIAALFKIGVGLATGSKGLVADGVHSVADAFSSLFILLALKAAGRPHDERHPFGYGKIEYISTLSASLFLFVAASLIFVDALNAFTDGAHHVPDNVAILAITLSLGFSYILFTSNRCAGTELNSPALIADAYESKADSISSAAVLIGLIGTKMGFIYADTLAALAVSLFIFHMSVSMFLQGVHGLIDSAADEEVIKEMVTVSLEVEGVERVRAIKTMRMGQKNWVEMKIDVSRKRTVLEAHQIAEKVKETLLEKISGIGGISVSTVPVGMWGGGLT